MSSPSTTPPQQLPVSSQQSQLQQIFSSVDNNQLIRLKIAQSEKLIRRLGVYVLDASNMPLKDGKAQSFVVEVSYNGKTCTTHPVKDINPKWNCMYRFSIREIRKFDNVLSDPSSGIFTFKILMKSSLKNKLIGTSTLDISTLPLETVVEQRLKINLSDDAKKKQSESITINASSNECVLNIRLYLSTLPSGPRNLSPVRITDPIFDYPYRDKKDEVVPFKPGDIILYNLPGPVGSAMKLRTGMQWSSCGIVASLPRKWCGKFSLCVIEFSQNLERFNDMYAECPLQNGIMIYNLKERIHGAPGTEIWHLPIKAKYCSDEYTRALRNWALESHKDCK